MQLILHWFSAEVGVSVGEDNLTINMTLYFATDSLYHKYITYQVTYTVQNKCMLSYLKPQASHTVQKLTGMHVTDVFVSLESLVFYEQGLGDTMMSPNTCRGLGYSGPSAFYRGSHWVPVVWLLLDILDPVRVLFSLSSLVCGPSLQSNHSVGWKRFSRMTFLQVIRSCPAVWSWKDMHILAPVSVIINLRIFILPTVLSLILVIIIEILCQDFNMG